MRGLFQLMKKSAARASNDGGIAQLVEGLVRNKSWTISPKCFHALLPAFFIGKLVE
jgi:hypothetical protein